MTVAVVAIAGIPVTLTATVPFTNPLPATGVHSAIFPPISEGFGPGLLAAIAGGTGASILIVVSLVSVTPHNVYRTAEPTQPAEVREIEG